MNRVFWAQENQPVKNDWALQVREDLMKVGLGDISLTEIKSQKKDYFKKMIKMKIRNLAFSDLMREKEGKSKMRDLTYTELKMQDYLVSNELTRTEKQLLFKIRTKMINTPDNMGQNTPCKLCHISRDEMSHVLTCFVVKLACQDVSDSDSVQIIDAYGDITKQKKLVEV